VIARYKEDVSWANPYNKIIYNKSLPHDSAYIQLPNIGREAHTFLFHIINNWDNLATCTVFFQGTFNDQKEQRISSLKKFTEVGADEFYGENERQDYPPPDWKYPPSSNIEFSIQQFFEHILVIHYPPKESWIPGAYISVGQNLIKSRPKEYYMKLMEYLNSLPTEAQQTTFAHYMERSWKAIFTTNLTHS